MQITASISFSQEQAAHICCSKYVEVKLKDSVSFTVNSVFCGIAIDEAGM